MVTVIAMNPDGEIEMFLTDEPDEVILFAFSLHYSFAVKVADVL